MAFCAGMKEVLPDDSWYQIRDLLTLTYYEHIFLTKAALNDRRHTTVR